jgi:hypothetical protein
MSDIISGRQYEVLNKYDITVSSINADITSISSSNFNFNIKLPRNIPYNNVSVSACRIAKSYYTIDSSNDNFVLTDSVSTRTISLPIGFYTSATLSAQIPVSLNSAPNVYAMNVSSLTGKISITQTGGNNTFSITSTYDLPYFGLPANTTINSNIGTGVLVFPNVLSVQRTSSIRVVSNIVDSRQESLLTLYNVNSFPNLSDITYQNNDIVGNAKKLKNLFNTSFSFKILDDNFDLIDLNGGTVEIDLIFWV